MLSLQKLCYNLVDASRFGPWTAENIILMVQRKQSFLSNKYNFKRFSYVNHASSLNLWSINTVVVHFGNWSEKYRWLNFYLMNEVLFSTSTDQLLSISLLPTSINTNLIFVSNGYILFVSLWVVQFNVLVRLCLLSHAYLHNPDVDNLRLFSKSWVIFSSSTLRLF